MTGSSSGTNLCWYRGEGTFGYVGMVQGRSLPEFMRVLKMDEEHVLAVSQTVSPSKFYAIKVYKQGLRQDVLEEYSVAKKMAAAGVGVPVHGVAWSSRLGHCAIVMDLMRCSLKEAVPLGIVTDAEAVADQLMRKVSAMHAAGIVHRDIKPANVLVSDSNELFIADWGAAAEKGRRPSSGAMYTTLRYSAPEVLKAGGGWLGAWEAGDWWGVGCTVAFVALRGKDLFPGSVAWEQRVRYWSYARRGGSSVFLRPADERALSLGLRRGAMPLSPALGRILHALLNVEAKHRHPPSPSTSPTTTSRRSE